MRRYSSLHKKCNQDAFKARCSLDTAANNRPRASVLYTSYEYPTASEQELLSTTVGNLLRLAV